MKRQAIIVAVTILAVCAILSVVRAQGTALDVIKANYTRTLTTTATGQTVVTEEGTYQIAPDGTYRIDRVDHRHNDERTAEIQRFRDRKRIMLNIETKEAAIGSNGWAGALMVPPSSSRPQPGFPPLREDSKDRVDLGTKIVAGLTLRGTRTTLVSSNKSAVSIVHTSEIWAYHAPDPRIIPVILELRIESPYDIDDSHITDVTTARVSQDIFDVPRDFTIRK